MRIPFNIPPVVGTEKQYIENAIASKKLCGDGRYTKLCSEWMEDYFKVQKVLLTTSCTHALEMAAFLCELRPGDEVIMPSYTFVSTANAFLLQGAKIVFIDIRPDTQNMDETLIEQAVTNKTKAIVPVHYAGVSCEMDTIMEIADKNGILVVEDAAQGVNAFYKGKALGTIGDFGCYSFHETKNYTMGEGGAIAIHSEKKNLDAEIIREKGTNRREFALGLVDKYTWVGKGSSYLPSEINTAYLYGQLEQADMINKARLSRYNQYHILLKDLEKENKIQLPILPESCTHNAHMFYIKTRSLEERIALMEHLERADISTAFHYVPLHSSPQGVKSGCFRGTDRYTTDTANRLLRLPMYKDLQSKEVEYVCERIYEFYRE